LLGGLVSSTADQLSDSELLQQFCQQRDEEAFAALVRRHGPLVLGVCQRLLRHEQDAEDAFQATFLVLVQKAAGVQGRDTLAGFLYSVAYRTALKARSLAARRLRKEAEVAAQVPSQWSSDDHPELDTELLDRELSRLPDRYRLPVLLCDLEGKSRKDAAELLGCSEGTLSGRLARARKRLADRLRQAGCGAAAVAVPVPSVTPTLLASTVRTAAAFAAGGAGTAVPAQVLTLAHGVMKSMLLATLQKTALGVLAVAGVCLALWGVSGLLAPAAAVAPIPEAPAKPPEVPAVQIGLVPDYLLRDRKVLRELSTTAEQRDAIADQIEAAEEEAMKLYTQLLQNPQNVQQEEQVAKVQQQIEGMLRDAARKAIKDVLDHKQQTRLVQVALQAAGPEVFREEAVARELKLTDKQKQKVEESIKKVQETIEKLFNPDDPKALVAPQAYTPEALQKISDAAKKDIVDGLTKEQQDTWKAMLGKPINFVPRQQDGSYFPFAAGGNFPAVPAAGVARPLQIKP
jgi:RNA polymerase sigma factor (sigma-70 family)